MSTGCVFWGLWSTKMFVEFLCRVIFSSTRLWLRHSAWLLWKEPAVGCRFVAIHLITAEWENTRVMYGRETNAQQREFNIFFLRVYRNNTYYYIFYVNKRNVKAVIWDLNLNWIVSDQSCHSSSVVTWRLLLLAQFKKKQKTGFYTYMIFFLLLFPRWLALVWVAFLRYYLRSWSRCVSQRCAPCVLVLRQ